MKKSQIMEWCNILKTEWLKQVAEMPDYYTPLTYTKVYIDEIEGQIMVGLEFHYGDWQQDCYTRMSMNTEQLSIPTLLKIKRVWEECIELEWVE